MPEEGVELRDKSEFMSSEEIFGLAKTFVNLGVNKIRITGGEPLIKKDISNILTSLSSLPVDLFLTNYGILIDKHLSLFKKINLKNINVSLDSLNADKFNNITKRTYFDRVMSNIDLLIANLFKVKINVVLMRGVNENEIIDFIEMTKFKPIDVRFIEFMPFSGNEWDTTKVVPLAEILDKVQSHYAFNDIEALSGDLNGTSKNYKIKSFEGRFGVISSVTNPFCDGCNRMRLTADGKLKNCLFSNQETDLLKDYRNGKNIVPLIHESIEAKHSKRAGISDFSNENKLLFEQNRNMTSIGG